MASERKERIRSAHKVLGVYWLINVLRGKSPLKAALQTLVIEGNFLKRELLGQQGTSNGNKGKQGTVKGSAAKSGLLSQKAAAGSLKGRVLRGAVREILKKERVF